MIALLIQVALAAQCTPAAYLCNLGRAPTYSEQEAGRMAAQRLQAERELIDRQADATRAASDSQAEAARVLPTEVQRLWTLPRVVATSTWRNRLEDTVGDPLGCYARYCSLGRSYDLSSSYPAWCHSENGEAGQWCFGDRPFEGVRATQGWPTDAS